MVTPDAMSTAVGVPHVVPVRLKDTMLRVVRALVSAIHSLPAFWNTNVQGEYVACREGGQTGGRGVTS